MNDGEKPMHEFRASIRFGRDKSGKRWFYIIHPDGRIQAKDGVYVPLEVFLNKIFGRVTKDDRVFPVKPPGEGLVRLARRIFSAQSFEQVFEPAISDLQFEYSIAISEGKLWKARRHRVHGYWAFLRTTVIFVLCSAVKMLRRRATKA